MSLIPRETATWIPLTIQTSADELIFVSRARAEFLYDSNDIEYIDGTASWWTSIHGHCHPKIIRSITKQAETLDHVMLAGFVHDPAESLAKKLLSLSGNVFEKVFYSDNGSNAVEIALKIAVQYYQNKAGIGETDKTQFITFSASYHGDSIGAMNVSGVTYFNRIFSSLRFPTKEFPAPNCHACPVGRSRETCNTECLHDLEIEVTANSGKYAGIVIEPLVFGASGMSFYDAKVLRKLETLANKADVLFILDEVFTGMGRTGNPFAFQTAEIKPDLVAMAKGLTGGSLPLAATLVSEKIYKQFLNEDPYASFFHAHTMTGNPIACAAGLASVEILLEHGLDQVAQLSRSLLSRLEALHAQFPEKVKNPRVLGAIAAFELSANVAVDEYLNPLGKRLKAELLKWGVLLRPLGSTVYITPSYSIHESSLDRIFEALERAITSL
jgi:adenosylmethionine-8-amino-7-oxononanoate aminotransferase